MSSVRAACGFRGNPVQVYPALGMNGVGRMENLLLQGGVARVHSPRQASILLVAGSVPARAFSALQRLHDQMPHPRASVCWPGGAGALKDAVRCDEPSDTMGVVLRKMQADLLSGAQGSEADLLPDEPPAPWRGKGDHGQGGESMMGGTPYGRPLAMTGDDLRDGLSLDRYPVRVGPFAPMLPHGLELEVTLQGDVIQEVSLVHLPFPEPEALAPFERVLHGAGALARLECLRAAHHLRCVARFARLRGNNPTGLRLLRAARRLAAGEPVEVRRLVRVLRWKGLFIGIEPGLGVLQRQDRHALAGPALRASGEPQDARQGLSAYREAGFQPAIRSGGDVRCRIRQWLDEAVQALQLAEAFEKNTAAVEVPFEGPCGPLRPGAKPPGPLSADAFNRLLQGLEWGQAMTVLASFDSNSLHRMLSGAES